MPKQLNVDLRFNADTSQAKKQIQDLQTSLSQLGQNVNISKSFGGINSELTSALSTVNTLKTQLDRAFNTQTGKLDLTKFTQEMERSGMSLEKYQQSLVKLGPEGSKAFAQLANSIAAADIPLMRTNRLLTEMGTVLKNTIKWQISSSAIHGFMGAIQQAYGYAQDLNESLTNIQIVTGQSTNQMATFAAQANKAAQALSTTTTAYTDAALIFYQQGLDDKAVEERTNATIKMAQVTGDSAQEVSSYMTAIWNNFDNGSESLEHYADVITALGAATASSSAEISQGLEKFASIADTVGLSYEYATTALATVVAQTRQSADVVGTAFKTMFARIQDLELGKTLEDGVDLGQYSKALAKVGVDVMDANGQLRAMDDILDDIGQRWSELGEAERVALAQNVAGQRQYAQFMAIFENWDTFQENLSVANTANGTLQEQADIYAESWEASQKRVKAAMEGIYQSIIDDKFFIKANDFLSDNIKGVNNLIKVLGGLPGLLTYIGSLATTLFNHQIAEQLRTTILTLKSLTPSGRANIKEQQTKALTLAQNVYAEDSPRNKIEQQRLEIQQEYLLNAEKLNDFEAQAVDLGLKQVDNLKRQVEETIKLTEEAEKELQLVVSGQNADARHSGLTNKAQSSILFDREAYEDQFNIMQKEFSEANFSFDKLASIENIFDFSKFETVPEIQKYIKDLTKDIQLTAEETEHLNKALSTTDRGEAQRELDKAFKRLHDTVGETENMFQIYRKGLISIYGDSEKATQEAVKFEQALMGLSEATRKQIEEEARYEAHLQSLSEYLQQASGNTIDWANAIVGFGSSLMQISMVINQFKGLKNIWSDDDTSIGDKLLSTLTSAAMILPILAKGYNALASAKTKEFLATAMGLATEEKVIANKLLEIGLDKREIASAVALLTSKKALSKATENEAAKQTLETIAKKLNTGATFDLSTAEGVAALKTALLGDSALFTAGSLAALAVPILLIVGLLAALAATITVAIGKINEESNVAKEATNAATELASAYEEAANQYKNLKNEINDYQDTLNSLKTLTKGTEEYRDALREANEAAMDLVQAGHLDTTQYSWENGILTIDEDVLEQIEQNSRVQMVSALAAARMSAYNAQKAQNQVDLSTALYSDDATQRAQVRAQAEERARRNNQNTNNSRLGGSSGEPTQAQISQEQSVLLAQLNNEQREKIQELGQLYLEGGKVAVEASDYYQSAAIATQEAILEYCESLNEATNSLHAFSQEIVHMILGDEYSDNIQTFTSNEYEQEYARIEAELREEIQPLTAFDTHGNETAQGLWERLQEANEEYADALFTGVVAVGDEFGNIFAQPGRINFEYESPDSSEPKYLSEEQIISIIASYEASQGIENFASRVDTRLNSLDEQQRQNVEQILGTYRDGELHISEIVDQYAINNRPFLNSYDAFGIDSQSLKILADFTGVKNNRELLNQLGAAIQDSNEAFANQLEQYNQSTRDFRNNTEIQNVNNALARQILDIYDSFNSGSLGRNALTNIANNSSIEDLTSLFNEVKTIDWNNITLPQVFGQLQNLDLDINGEDLLDFANSMRVVTAETLEATATLYNQAQKIADGLTNVNDEISQEDYDQLTPAMQEFFALTIDGTYKLLASAQDFQELVESERIQTAVLDRESLRNQNIGDVDKGYGEAYETYMAQDLAIALHFDNLDELQEARQNGTVATDAAFNTAAYQIDQAQDTAMLDQEEWQDYADYIQEAANAIEEFNDNMSDIEAEIVAKSLMKMNQAIETLSSNFEEWNDIINNSDNSSQEFADAIIGLRQAVSELLDISEDFVSSTFLTNPENLTLIGKAAEGDAEAIEDLRTALSQDIIANIIIDNNITNGDEIMNQYNELVANLPDIKVGASIEGTDAFVENLNRMIEDTGMTVDQINALCDSLGFEAQFVSQEQPINNTITETITHHRRVNMRDTDKDGEDDSWDDIETTEMHEIPYEGKFTAFSMSTDGTTPQIRAITRKAGGAQNNFSSSNSGGGRSGGGGGGGKSGSKKDKKDPTGEIERYHVINNQIEDNEKALDRLSKAKDRAYGKAKLNAMDAEIAKQRESVELAERKLQEVEKYLELDSGAIAAFGAEFDANGTIVNYDQLMQQQIDKYNAAVEAYNNSAMDENAEAVFQQAEDDYNAFTEALKQYEETQDLWYEQAQAVADAKAEVLQLELEKTNYKVEIGIEWEEEDIARLDFMLKRIEDDAHKAAEAIGLLGERTVDAMDKYNVYQQGFADTLRNLGVGNAEDVIARASAGEDLYGMIGGIIDPNQMAQAVDQMDDYISNMMSSLEDAQESVDQAFEKVKDLFNENVKQMDTYIEKIEFCQKITKSYMNIVDIVGKKSLGITNEMLRTFNAESVTQAVNNEAAAKAKMDSIQAQLLESQARLAQASGEAEQKYWNEIIEEQEKELISATENFHQAWEDALQANLEAFENNIELVIEDFSNAVGDLNAMKAEWDLQKSLTDMWEPEYERWHQLSDLINDINKSVDENENLKYKQDLLDLETEIEQLQEQEAKLSEYDLNYLRLRYESKLAEIALEEAQAAKSQVRMSRDNEGNYSYVYTADEEAVNNAADDYRNKIYEMEKANEEYIDTLQQQLLEMHDKMLEDIQQAGELYGVGTQAYYDAVARIQETYVGQSEFIQLQMQNVFTNNQRLRDEDIVQYVAYTGDIAAENVDLQTSFGDTYMGIQTQTDDLQTYFNDTWLPALNETFDNVILKAEEYSQQNEAAMETAGTTMDGFRDRASQDILEVTERTTELTEETQRYGETAVDQFAKAAQAWQTGPGALLDAINAQATAIANLAQQYISLKSQLDAAAQAARDFAAAMGQRVNASASIPSVSPSGGPGSSSSGSSGNGGGDGKGTLINSGTVTPTVHSGDYYRWLESEDPNAELRRRGLLRFFDTGGYTGEWGDDGRLAVLHQKELVLNAKDTSNILTAVDVVRQLASSIDFNTMTANLATTNIKSASGNSGTLEQRVEITANFPNATDRNEIEQAFQNIVNMASQYAQRKND